MTRKNKRKTTENGFPIDDRPVIFNLIETNDINFVGRYIESEAMFMLSLNDEQSDFVPQKEVNEWWYIDEHEIIVREILNKKSLKKEKIKKVENEKYKRKSDDSSNKTDSNEDSNTHTFSAPKLSPLPHFLRDFVNDLQRSLGTQFQSVQVRTIGQDELHTLPIEVLQQLLEKAEADENFELAILVRDEINKKTK
jgi:hypothetical protein